MVAAETSAGFQPGPVEIRFPVDTGQPVLAHAWADVVEIDAVGTGGTLTLVLPIGTVRTWTADVFAAASRAYREATGDPHALSDAVLASLPDPDRYVRTGGRLVQGTDDQPAQVRFVIALTVQAHTISTSMLAEAIVDTLLNRFNTVEVLVDGGTTLSGTITP